ncbi:hypothetical protein ALC60_01108, partial [Trachymyrmex zeteki]
KYYKVHKSLFYKLISYVSDNRNNNRNDHRNNVLHQQQLQQCTTITIREKRTKNQLQRQVHPKPEPKFESKSEPEPQLNPQPEEEPTSEEVLEEYDSKPVSLFEFANLDLQLENLNGKPVSKFELNEPDLSQLHENLKPIESLPISDLECSLYEENCSQKNEQVNSEERPLAESIFDLERISLPLSEKTLDFEHRQFKTYCIKRNIRLLKRDIFMNRRSPYAIMKPLVKRYHDFEEVYGDTVNKILDKIKPSNSQCSSSVPSNSSEVDSPVRTKSCETNNPVPSKSSEADSSVSSRSSEADNAVYSTSSKTDSPVPLKFSEADNCLDYMSDGDEEYTTRCKNRAAIANKEAEEESFKCSWKDVEPNDSFETDFFEDEAADSRITVKEEQQVSFRHVFNVSQLVMAHVSVPKSPSLLKPLLSTASHTSSEALSSPPEVSTSSLDILPSPTAIKNPLNNEDINQRITRRKAEEIQQQMAYKIKKNTLIDHCYHQTNVPETFQVFKEEFETEESGK